MSLFTMKVFCDVVDHTSDSAIDQIYLIYDQGKSNSKITKDLRMNKKGSIDRLLLS